MFTGLVETQGIVVAKEPSAESVRLTVESALAASDAKIGDSIAVNGCCLTVVAIDGPRLAFDLLLETERRTNLHAAQPGHGVNLERSLRADGRLGGHFVTGHVEAVGSVLRWELQGKDYLLEIGFDPAYDRYLVPKGCIAIDGISLTVAEVAPGRFTVWIIPHTREVTTLGARQVGDPVNLEFDLLAKYAAKLLQS